MRPGLRRAAPVAMLLALAVGLGACGGASNVSEVAPNSTPEITPPTNTAGEKESTQTTTTTTKSSSSSTSTAGTSETEAPSPAAESPETGAAGGTAVHEETKEEPKETKEATGGGTNTPASPTGGASVPEK